MIGGRYELNREQVGPNRESCKNPKPKQDFFFQRPFTVFFQFRSSSLLAWVRQCCTRTPGLAYIIHRVLAQF